MKKVLLLVALLVTSVSLVNASRPVGPLTRTPNPVPLDNRCVEVDVYRSSITFAFDRPVSSVSVENINSGASFSCYSNLATPWHSMDFAPGNGTWVVKADGFIYGRFNIGFASWPDPIGDLPEMEDPWGDKEGGFDYGEFDFDQGVNLYPVDWFDEGNGPVVVRFHF